MTTLPKKEDDDLPKGAGRLPKWWLLLTPHDKVEDWIVAKKNKSTAAEIAWAIKDDDDLSANASEHDKPMIDHISSDGMAGTTSDSDKNGTLHEDPTPSILQDSLFSTVFFEPLGETNGVEKKSSVNTVEEEFIEDVQPLSPEKLPALLSTVFSEPLGETNGVEVKNSVNTVEEEFVEDIQPLSPEKLPAMDEQNDIDDTTTNNEQDSLPMDQACENEMVANDEEMQTESCQESSPVITANTMVSNSGDEEPLSQDYPLKDSKMTMHLDLENVPSDDTTRILQRTSITPEDADDADATMAMEAITFGPENLRHVTLGDRPSASWEQPTLVAGQHLLKKAGSPKLLNTPQLSSTETITTTETTTPAASTIQSLTNLTEASGDAGAEARKADSGRVVAPAPTRTPRVFKTAFTGVSTFDFAMQQRAQEKERRERVRLDKEGLARHHAQVALVDEATELKKKHAEELRIKKEAEENLKNFKNDHSVGQFDTAGTLKKLDLEQRKAKKDAKEHNHGFVASESFILRK